MVYSHLPFLFCFQSEIKKLICDLESTNLKALSGGIRNWLRRRQRRIADL